MDIICKKMKFDYREHPRYEEMIECAKQYFSKNYQKNYDLEEKEGLPEEDREYALPFLDYVLENRKEYERSIVKLTETFMKNYLNIPNTTVLMVEGADLRYVSEEKVKDALWKRYGIYPLDFVYTRAGNNEILLDNAYNKVEEMLDKGDFDKFFQLRDRMGRYSLNNTSLIYAQKPDAVMVTSRSNWDKFKRKITDWSDNIQIWTPAQKVLDSKVAVESHLEWLKDNYPDDWPEKKIEKRRDYLLGKLEKEGSVLLKREYKLGFVYDINNTKCTLPEDNYDELVKPEKPLGKGFDEYKNVCEALDNSFGKYPQARDLSLGEEDRLYKQIYDYCEERLRKAPSEIGGIWDKEVYKGAKHDIECLVATYFICSHIGLDCLERITNELAKLTGGGNHEISPDNPCITEGRRNMFEKPFNRGQYLAVEFNDIFDKQYEPALEQKKIKNKDKDVR